MLLAGRMLSKFRHCVGISDALSVAADQSTCARIGRNTAPLGTADNSGKWHFIVVAVMTTLPQERQFLITCE